MRRKASPTSRWLALAIAGLGMWTWTTSAQAAEIKVLSAGAVKGIVTELAETFRQETGHTVTITPGTAGELRQKVEAGDSADVVIVTDTVLEQLAAKRLVVADTRADLARTAIGVAVREGAPLPDISTVEAFKQTVLAAKSLVYTDPGRGATSGIHFAGVLQRLGIADAVKDKTVLWPGGYAAEAIVKGQAELCVHQISEILPVKGVTLVGPLPRELQKITTYSAAISTRAATPETARSFIAFVTRPSFKQKFVVAGLDYRE
ncbi:MAG TPA: substrate-binding domain-containing protein [Methylomirabilota bacterium]|nr:substrate-binding domain-containing protein [Methylomirabilota bacterium]